MNKTLDIRDYPEVIDTVNAIINNKGIAEVKIEHANVPVVVEIKRTKRVPKN